MPVFSFADAALLGALAQGSHELGRDPYPVYVFQEVVGIAVLLAAAIGMLSAALKTGLVLARWKRRVVSQWRCRRLSAAERAGLQFGVTVRIDGMQAALDELASGCPRPLTDGERAAFHAYRRQLERFRVAPNSESAGRREAQCDDRHADR
jgi:hypothetical protein